MKKDKLIANIPSDMSDTVNGDVYLSDPGLRIHVEKKHGDELCETVLENLEEYIVDIISNPDYIGHNSRHLNSVEFVKKINEYYLVAVKVEYNGKKNYVATFHEINETKINKRLKSKRLREYTATNVFKESND